MTINERLSKLIRILFGGNKSALASRLGVTPSVIDNIVGKRQSKPSFDLIEKLSSIEEINLDWLITGHGSPLSSRRCENGEKQPSLNSPEPQININAFDERLLVIIAEKDATIRAQAEEIGRLKERLAQYEEGKNTVPAAHSDTVTHASRQMDVVSLASESV